MNKSAFIILVLFNVIFKIALSMESGQAGKIPPLKQMTQGNNLKNFKPYISSFFKDILLYSVTESKDKDLRFYDGFDKRLDGYKIVCTQSELCKKDKDQNRYTSKVVSRGFLYDYEAIIRLRAKPTKDQWYTEKDIDTHKLSDVSIPKVMFEERIWHPKAVSLVAGSLCMFGFAVYSYYRGWSMKIGA